MPKALVNAQEQAPPLELEELLDPDDELLGLGQGPRSCGSAVVEQLHRSPPTQSLSPQPSTRETPPWATPQWQPAVPVELADAEAVVVDEFVEHAAPIRKPPTRMYATTWRTFMGE
jgi:hypothetical protein